MQDREALLSMLIRWALKGRKGLAAPLATLLQPGKDWLNPCSYTPAGGPEERDRTGYLTQSPKSPE